MTKTPAPSALLERLRDPGFTPRVREVGALVDLLADEEHGKAAARALGRVGDAATATLVERLASATGPLRAHVVKALGRQLPDPPAAGALLGVLRDADPKARRNAVIALGHLAGRPDVEDALLEVWDRDPRPEMRRSVAASLGKVGTARSLPLLRDAAGSDDPELVRIAERGRAMVERTATRGDGGHVDASRVAPRPTDIAVACRRGLEELLAEELAGIASVVDVRVTGPGQVRARLAGALGAVFAARTMHSLRFPLPTERATDGDVPDAIARAVAGDAARAVFATWTAGTPRYRIAWGDGAHKRAATWDAVRATAARAPDLVNDPSQSTWELEVTLSAGAVDVAIAPRALEDPRFAWRRGDVPAASHPTMAAALARVAGLRDDDVVWDPFVGSGGELVERALLGPHRALFGGDVDPRALDVAAANLASAGYSATLERRDALEPAPPGVTLVITNPPMGRRAVRSPGLPETLDRFVAHAAASLARGGRLVWIAPWPERARAAGKRAGLALDWARTVDMGGFDAELQRWKK